MASNLYTLADLEAIIPSDFLLLAMDDDGDGIIDQGVFDAIHGMAQGRILGFLEQAGIPAIPDPAPTRLRHFAQRYAEMMLYRRRGQFERARDIQESFLAGEEKWLGRIATGQESLLPAADPAASDSISGAIVEDAKSYLSTGGMMI